MNENPDMSVKVYPVRNGGSLLATASLTLGGGFAVRGIKIWDGENGSFVSMPQRRDAKGRYHDICFPTTAELRKAISEAVLGEYERTAQRSSVLGALREKQPERGETRRHGRRRDMEAR